jgi:hypothetical protein
LRSYYGNGDRAFGQATVPVDGDLIFTQASAINPDLFEFLTLKRVDLSTLRATDNGICSGGQFRTGEGNFVISSSL